MTEKSPWIIEATSTTFERDVVEKSSERPVVVDFWAPWCGPCRQLAPILEQLADEYQGRFVLAKVNIDESPELAGAFGVQSIPLVVGIRDAQAVDQFMGLLPESGIREWIERLFPSPADDLLNQGSVLEDDDPDAAEQKYREAAELDPQNANVRIHLARVLLKLDRTDESAAIIAELQKRGYLEPEAEKIRSQLELKTAAQEAGSVDDARAAAEAAPEDLTLKLKLADALAASGRHEEALDICLELIQRDTAGIGDHARQTMIRIFDTLGRESELAGTYRRRLASALY